MESLEKLYLPSRWSDRFPPEEIVERHVEFCTRESEKARQTIPCILNIPYGLLPKEKIDVFGTDLKKDSPVFVFVHGGYWQEESLKRDTYHFIAQNLYQNGIKSIFVGYELCPNVSLEKILEEIVMATKKCIDYAKENNSKGLCIGGYSAGAHLVAALFTNIVENFDKEDRSFIKSAILLGGIYSLKELPKTSINVPLKLTEDKAIRLSPQIQQIVSDLSTKFYIISAENDSPEFKQQSEKFYEKLQKSGVDSKAQVIEKVDHFDMVELLADTDFQLTKLILNFINSS